MRRKAPQGKASCPIPSFERFGHFAKGDHEPLIGVVEFLPDLLAEGVEERRRRLLASIRAGLWILAEDPLDSQGLKPSLGTTRAAA